MITAVYFCPYIAYLENVSSRKKEIETAGLKASILIIVLKYRCGFFISSLTDKNHARF
jgi:hypothetical protein